MPHCLCLLGIILVALALWLWLPPVAIGFIGALLVAIGVSLKRMEGGT